MVLQYIAQTFTLSAPNLSINGFDLDATTFPAVYLSELSTTNTTANGGKKNTRSSRKQQRDQEQELGPEVQYEPFDARKRARVEELARQEEDLMREIAALKRKLPGAAAQGYTDGFWEGVKRDEAAFAAAKERALRPFVSGDEEGEGEEEESNNTTARVEEAGAADVDGDSGGRSSGNKKKSQNKKQQSGSSSGKKKLLDGVDSQLERQTEVQERFAGVVDTLGRLKREMPATVAKMERARVAGEYVVTER